MILRKIFSKSASEKQKPLGKKLISKIIDNKIDQAIAIAKEISPEELNQAIDKDNNTPLMIGIMCKQQALCAILIPKMNTGAINKVNYYNNTALLLAVRMGYEEICSMLLPKMDLISISHLDAKGYNAFGMATKENNKKIMLIINRHLIDTYINNSSFEDEKDVLAFSFEHLSYIFKENLFD